ncbi:hypothetical protein BO82DRAFT_24009 [Aspergillus uvarum CBS 121591]|uniref:Uncharacterized protein n=1 Tax=Aspergillus uvarum CBS 121591 TaxID=1448315 RepID=A0A319CI96_9EURO|nr:hypothetical protein BO82DRAFT_24009 [Aspergillus uvarum CBS 121591]PYH84180.1 hypothetical protein BO82DRAFT_24009 [Aspergillus uvarum CBS 121591]
MTVQSVVWAPRGRVSFLCLPRPCIRWRNSFVVRLYFVGHHIQLTITSASLPNPSIHIHWKVWFTTICIEFLGIIYCLFLNRPLDPLRNSRLDTSWLLPLEAPATSSPAYSYYNTLLRAYDTRFDMHSASTYSPVPSCLSTRSTIRIMGVGKCNDFLTSGNIRLPCPCERGIYPVYLDKSKQVSQSDPCKECSHTLAMHDDYEHPSEGSLSVSDTEEQQLVETNGEFEGYNLPVLLSYPS